MAAIYNEIREKRNILRDLYGGMMTLSDLSRELGMKPEDAKVWAIEQGLCVQLGKRLKVETDMLAKFIVQRRGMV